MKLFYLNDRKIPVRVSIETLHDGVMLEPAQGQEFEVEVPEGRMLFVKAWEHSQVLIGTMIKEDKNDTNTDVVHIIKGQMDKEKNNER